MDTNILDVLIARLEYAAQNNISPTIGGVVFSINECEQAAKLMRDLQKAGAASSRYMGKVTILNGGIDAAVNVLIGRIAPNKGSNPCADALAALGSAQFRAENL